MVRNVSFVELDPETEPLSQLFPLLHVLPNGLLALLNEGLNSVSFDILFGVNTQLFTDLDFDRQTMRVPARFSLAVETFHRLVTRKKILDRAGQTVTRVRFPVSRRRTFEKDVSLAVLSSVERLLIDVVFVPERERFDFVFRKVKFGAFALRGHALFANLGMKIKPLNIPEPGRNHNPADLLARRQRGGSSAVTRAKVVHSDQGLCIPVD